MLLVDLANGQRDIVTLLKDILQEKAKHNEKVTLWSLLNECFKKRELFQVYFKRPYYFIDNEPFDLNLEQDFELLKAVGILKRVNAEEYEVNYELLRRLLQEMYDDGKGNSRRI